MSKQRTQTRRDFLKTGIETLAACSLSANDIRASLCRDSFYDFMVNFWDTIVPERLVLNWHMKILCNELQKVAERVFNNQPREYDLIINISPGSTKSTICSIMFPAWVWTRMASARIIGGSYSKELSLELARRNRELIRSEKFAATYPKIVMKYDQNVKSHFANTQGGGRLATSTGATITGFHAHFIIIDDPLNPGEAISEVELKSANTWMAETLYNRKVDQNLTPTILIMQRLHQGDPTADMIMRAEMAARNMELLTGEKNSKPKIKHICLPAEKTPKIQPKNLRRYYKDGVMDTKRLNHKILAHNKAMLGDYAYAGQYLQDPVPRGGGMFKTDRLIVEEQLPIHTKFVKVVRFWDKAGTQGGTGAFTVGCKMGKDRKNRIWILDIIRGRWSSEVREKIIKQTAIIDGKDCWIGIEQEPGSGGKESMENTVRNLLGFHVYVDRPSGSQATKELRADPLSVQVNAGNVYLLRGTWNRELIEEMQFFPASIYKDQVDAASGAFNRIAQIPKKVGGLW